MASFTCTGADAVAGVGAILVEGTEETAVDGGWSYKSNDQQFHFIINLITWMKVWVNTYNY